MQSIESEPEQGEENDSNGDEWSGETSEDEDWSEWEGALSDAFYNPSGTFEADGLGYPDVGLTPVLRRLSVPRLDYEEVENAMRRAAHDAHPEVRAALATSLGDREIAAWWAAHSAGPVLGGKWGLEAMLEASFACEPVDALSPYPGDLPPEGEVRARIAGLERALCFHRH